VKRREFFTVLGGAALGWPTCVKAQPKMPVLGFLASASEARYTSTLAAVIRPTSACAHGLLHSH
jgi:hypothetical protein